ncbi:MAG: hypothetical protein ABIJ09_17670 [Pseudomonadota bacterium]
MGWTELSYPKLAEKDIQRLLDDWPRRQQIGWAIAACPQWLSNIQSRNITQQLKTKWGYKYRPDVIWDADATVYVVELKHAAKYEPIAIAEVLHHAQMLKEHGLRDMGIDRQAHVQPAVLTQYNGWIRSTVAWMRENGVDSERFIVLEMTVVEDETRRYLLLNSPFASWQEGTPPESLPRHVRTKCRYWYFVENDGSWYGLDRKQTDRPLLLQEQCVVASPVEGDQNSWVIWFGREQEKYVSCSLWRPRVGNHGALQIMFSGA